MGVVVSPSWAIVRTGDCIFAIVSGVCIEILSRGCTLPEDGRRFRVERRGGGRERGGGR